MTKEPKLVVRDLGRMPYAQAFALQKTLQREVIESRAGGERSHYLLLVEHEPPVITVSRRPDARRHLVAGDETLARLGIEVAETDRGGDITYHGPGQLVAYPILDLNVVGLRLHGYMRFLEQVVIDTLASFGINAGRDEAATGVWVARSGDADADADAGADAKICAMGVRISRWVTMHGLALNVTTDLDHFDLIVPCGLGGRTVTSMQQLLDDACPTMQDVRHRLVETFVAGLTPARAPAPPSPDR